MTAERGEGGEGGHSCLVSCGNGLRVGNRGGGGRGAGNRENTILFCMQDGKRRLPPAACAVLRHAWGHMYRHFTRVETDKIPFKGEVAFYHTLKGLGDAALRIAMTHRFTTTRTKHGQRPIRPPKLECAKDIINLVTPAVDPKIRCTPRRTLGFSDFSA